MLFLHAINVSIFLRCLKTDNLGQPKLLLLKMKVKTNGTLLHFGYNQLEKHASNTKMLTATHLNILNQGLSQYF